MSESLEQLQELEGKKPNKPRNKKVVNPALGNKGNYPRWDNEEAILPAIYTQDPRYMNNELNVYNYPNALEQPAIICKVLPNGEVIPIGKEGDANMGNQAINTPLNNNLPHSNIPNAYTPIKQSTSQTGYNPINQGWAMAPLSVAQQNAAYSLAAKAQANRAQATAGNEQNNLYRVLNNPEVQNKALTIQQNNPNLSYSDALNITAVQALQNQGDVYLANRLYKELVEPQEKNKQEKDLYLSTLTQNEYNPEPSLLTGQELPYSPKLTYDENKINADYGNNNIITQDNIQEGIDNNLQTYSNLNSIDIDKNLQNQINSNIKNRNIENLLKLKQEPVFEKNQIQAQKNEDLKVKYELDNQYKQDALKTKVDLNNINNDIKKYEIKVKEDKYNNDNKYKLQDLNLKKDKLNKELDLKREYNSNLNDYNKSRLELNALSQEIRKYGIDANREAKLQILKQKATSDLNKLNQNQSRIENLNKYRQSSIEWNKTKYVLSKILDGKKPISSNDKQAVNNSIRVLADLIRQSDTPQEKSFYKKQLDAIYNSISTGTALDFNKGTELYQNNTSPFRL